MGVTINSIRSGVTLALSRYFPDFDIYGEGIKQGLDPPCFFVKMISAEQDQELGIRYKRYHSFDIHFFPTDNMGANREMHDIAERLYDQLETIKVGDSIYRGTNMNHRIIENVLHFFIDFNLHVLRKVPGNPKMQTLEQDLRTGGHSLND